MSSTNSNTKSWSPFDSPFGRSPTTPEGAFRSSFGDDSAFVPPSFASPSLGNEEPAFASSFPPRNAQWTDANGNDTYPFPQRPSFVNDYAAVPPFTPFGYDPFAFPSQTPQGNAFTGECNYYDTVFPRNTEENVNWNCGEPILDADNGFWYTTMDYKLYVAPLHPFSPGSFQQKPLKRVLHELVQQLTAGRVFHEDVYEPAKESPCVVWDIYDAEQREPEELQEDAEFVKVLSWIDAVMDREIRSVTGVLEANERSLDETMEKDSTQWTEEEASVEGETEEAVSTDGSEEQLLEADDGTLTHADNDLSEETTEGESMGVDTVEALERYFCEVDLAPYEKRAKKATRRLGTLAHFATLACLPKPLRSIFREERRRLMALSFMQFDPHDEQHIQILKEICYAYTGRSDVWELGAEEMGDELGSKGEDGSIAFREGGMLTLWMMLNFYRHNKEASLKAFRDSKGDGGYPFATVCDHLTGSVIKALKNGKLNAFLTRPGTTENEKCNSAGGRLTKTLKQLSTGLLYKFHHQKMHSGDSVDVAMGTAKRCLKKEVGMILAIAQVPDILSIDEKLLREPSLRSRIRSMFKATSV